MIDFAKVVLPSEDEVRAVLQAAAGEPKLAAALVAAIAAERQAFVFRSLVWLVKRGALKVPWIAKMAMTTMHALLTLQRYSHGSLDDSQCR